MATTKTLTPTNQAITLAAFTEKPDNRTNVTNDDKLADAVNALNSNITNHVKWVDVPFTTAVTVNSHENTFQIYTPPAGYRVLYAYLDSDGYADTTYFIPWINTWGGNVRLNFYNESSASHTIQTGIIIRVALLSI